MVPWRGELDVSLVWKGLPFEQMRDGVVERIRQSAWYRESDDEDGDGGSVGALAEDLAATTNPAEFDEVWSAIYDLADVDRIWIVTRKGKATV